MELQERGGAKAILPVIGGQWGKEVTQSSSSEKRDTSLELAASSPPPPTPPRGRSGSQVSQANDHFTGTIVGH